MKHAFQLAQAFAEFHNRAPCDIVGLGEMGIGNTTSATAIICTITGVKPDEAAGRGTGVDDNGLDRKRKALNKALAYHKPSKDDPLEILCKVGGYEIAGICGAALEAASRGVAVVLDGIISTAGGALAWMFNREIKEYMFSGHKSAETGQQHILEMMGLEPVVDFQMRLGEGTGAALTMGLIDSACTLMRAMATFKEAGISSRSD